MKGEKMQNNEVRCIALVAAAAAEAREEETKNEHTKVCMGITKAMTECVCVFVDD